MFRSFALSFIEHDSRQLFVLATVKLNDAALLPPTLPVCTFWFVWWCICILLIDGLATSTGLIWTSLFNCVDECNKALASMSVNWATLRILDIEKLMFAEAFSSTAATAEDDDDDDEAPKLMFALIWCWFIRPLDVADGIGMFEFWFVIGCCCWCCCCCGCMNPPDCCCCCSTAKSGFVVTVADEFFTCGAWLCWPVVLRIRPDAVMQRARHVVRR